MRKIKKAKFLKQIHILDLKMRPICRFTSKSYREWGKGVYWVRVDIGKEWLAKVTCLKCKKGAKK